MSRRPATRRIGRRTASWATVHGAAALALTVHRRLRGPMDPARLRRRLLLNATLDVGYLGAGAALARPRDARTADHRDQGLAMLAQGAFLLALDSLAARALRR